MIEYDELENILSEANAGIRAAECHGFICAVICTTTNVNQDIVKHYLLADEMQDIMHESYDSIMHLVAEIIEQMRSINMDLQLMLPDEDSTLKARCEALVEWCQGFLSGLGVGGINKSELTDACKTLVEDLYKVSLLETEDIDKQGEQGEKDLMELIEYVRMGAIYLYDECHNGILSTENHSGVLH